MTHFKFKLFDLDVYCVGVQDPVPLMSRFLSEHEEWEWDVLLLASCPYLESPYRSYATCTWEAQTTSAYALGRRYARWAVCCEWLSESFTDKSCVRVTVALSLLLPQRRKLLELWDECEKGPHGPDNKWVADQSWKRLQLVDTYGRVWGI